MGKPLIREATAADCPVLADYCQRLFDESGFVDWLHYDADKTAAFIAHLMASDEGLVLIAKGGFMVAMLINVFFSPDRWCQELLWWAAPDKRRHRLGLALRDALEDWARHKRAHVLAMGAPDFGVGEKRRRHYVNAGYTPMEHSYLMRLGPCP